MDKIDKAFGFISDFDIQISESLANMRCIPQFKGTDYEYIHER